MDDIVRQALAKWPNVPSCTGWLMLDRRGNWRMRDEAAQASGALGTPIRHEALLAFINRNYEVDEQGQWFFQNGPQRVYVELGYTPWVVRLSAHDGSAPALTDQAGNAFEPAAVFVDDEGGIVFVDGSQPPKVAALHDHDLDVFSEHAEIAEGDPVSGSFQWHGRRMPLQPVRHDEVAARFGFVASPAAQAK
ncbi:MAG TPA: DUF2946 family protein [Paraburkholderia sp.]|jgi:hypothetical protein|nr:DUF2946 family protein [Paraburkholderia sp.]